MSRFKYALLIISILLVASDTIASTNVNVNDDTYDLLLRLEAEGIIHSGLLTTKPLSRKEAIRLVLEAERNSADKSLFIQQVVISLKERLNDGTDGTKYIKPVSAAYGKYLYSDSENSEKIVYNNDGNHYEKGSNIRFGLSSITDAGWFSFSINPEIRHSDTDTDITIKTGYAVLNFSGLDLELGKDSQWWGPGYHGSLLYSNNAEPLTMLKLNNPHPLILPSVFKYLGLFKFTLFATRLEEDRTIPNPYLWGLRLIFKTSPYFELGLQRTAILGGEGRPENYKAWVKSFTGEGENIDGGVSDQKAGLDIKITLPFSWQPLQLYAELAGEDEAGGLPSKEAYLAGVYLPRILNLEELNISFEYAINHVNGHPNVWYGHGIYTSGYTFKDRVIGHHMGTDSKDMFLEAQYLLPKLNSGSIAVSYNSEKHNLSGKIKETSDEFTLQIHLPVKKTTAFEAAYSFGKLKNLDNTKGRNEDINILTANITYKF